MTTASVCVPGAGEELIVFGMGRALPAVLTPHLIVFILCYVRQGCSFVCYFVFCLCAC